MEITKVPFVEHTGIRYDTSGTLELSAHKQIENHLGTIHASAQFALAETASGEYLQGLFPELADQVIPLLRNATIKYRKPASTSISAHASVPKDAVAAFQKQFKKRDAALSKLQLTLLTQTAQSPVLVSSNGLFNALRQAIKMRCADAD